MDRKHLVGVVALVCSVLLAAGPAVAQVTTGTVLGVARDETGAVLPGVVVTLRSEETGASREVTTGSDGSFSFIAVPVGRYTVTANLADFSKFVLSNIVLDVNQNYRVDAVLQVGEVTDEVVVEAKLTQVETVQASLGKVVESRRVAELPLNGRNYLELTALQPGVVPAIGLSSNFSPPTPGTGAPQVGGLRGQSNTFLLDGAENNELFLGEAAAVPSPDTIREFRIITNAFGAEFGRAGGSVVNVITKSGTNEVHGGLYEFLRNDAFDAHNFFSTEKPTLRRHQFGGLLGGPVVADRTFFFGSYEGLRLREGITRTATVPSLLERRGDFSASPVKPIDPATGAPFPGDQIPEDLIHSISRRLLEFFPEPNQGRNRYVASPISKNRRHQFSVKIDQNWSGSHQSFVRYFFDDGDSDFPFTNSFLGDIDVPTFPVLHASRFHNLVANHSHIWSPATLNVFRFAFNRGDLSGNVPAIPRSGRELGFTFPTTRPTDVPLIGIAGFSVIGVTNQGPAARVEDTYAAQYTLSHVRGRHMLKTGADFRHYQIDTDVYAIYNGVYNFAGLVTRNSFADFLLGRPFIFFQNGGATERGFRQNAFSVYAQDDFRINPRVTLNLGLRYELAPPVTELRDRFAAFRPGERSQVHPDAPIGMVFPGDPGVPRGTIETDTNNIAPRIGLAWDVRGDGKTSVRSAYGLFYDNISFYTPFQMVVSPPYNFIMSRFLPASFADPVGPGSPFQPGTERVPFVTPVQFNVLDPANRTPYVHQFNVSVQQELFGRYIVEVAYVGTRARNLIGTYELNPARFVPGQSTAGNVNQRRAHQNFASIFNQATIFTSEYDSLQVSASRPFSEGLSLQLAYTWSKALDVTSTPVNFRTAPGQPLLPMNSNDIEADRGPAAFDVPHRLAVNFMWELPAFAARGVARRLLEGWQLNGIWQVQSGSPFTVIDPADPNLDGNTNDRPNQTGDPRLANPTVERWFDTDAFSRVPLGTNRFGNAGRNSLRGPGLNRFDFSVFRNFRFGGGRLQFRAEIFNLFNRTNFALPVNIITSPNFGRILNTRASDERVMQFAFRFDF